MLQKPILHYLYAFEYIVHIQNNIYVCDRWLGDRLAAAAATVAVEEDGTAALSENNIKVSSDNDCN